MWPLVWKNWDDDVWTPLTNTVRTLCFVQKLMNTVGTVRVIYKLTEGRHNFVCKSYQNALHTDGTTEYLTITKSLLRNYWIKLNMSSRLFRSQPWSVSKYLHTFKHKYIITFPMEKKTLQWRPFQISERTNNSLSKLQKIQISVK